MSNSWLKLSVPTMRGDDHEPSTALTVCTRTLSFVQRTVSPATTSMRPGAKAANWIETPSSCAASLMPWPPIGPSIAPAAVALVSAARPTPSASREPSHFGLTW